jgi:hypothetical protein
LHLHEEPHNDNLIFLRCFVQRRHAVVVRNVNVASVTSLLATRHTPPTTVEQIPAKYAHLRCCVDELTRSVE